jgi:hypothetical protein
VKILATVLLILASAVRVLEASPESVPAHAHRISWGIGWDCDSGYRRGGNRCIPVIVPENGILDYSGHGWVCEWGYRRVGNRCIPVIVPENGVLDYSGHGWLCEDGYLKRDTRCIAVSEATDGEIRNLMIAMSITSYPGNCPCPYNADRAGRSCGGRSAYSRPGGYSPLCYESDISDADVHAFRAKYAP